MEATTDSAWDGHHPSVTHFRELFAYDHLPPYLQGVSRPFAELAEKMVGGLHSGPELSAGLRKLVEAKDCLVRQAVKDQAARS